MSSNAPRPVGLLARLARSVSRVGRIPLVGACLTATAAVGALDAVLPALLGLSAFYLLPVVVAAARDALSGVIVAWASAGASCAVDLIRHGDTYGSAAVPLANAVTRLAVFGLVVWLVSALRREFRYEADMARLDPLTDLPNTRSFYETAEAARRVLARTGRPLTLAYLDLDDFKRINDRLGHAAGDDVLRRTAAVLARSVRDVDTVARLGGDEFAVLLPDTAGDAAASVLERVRQHLHAEVDIGDAAVPRGAGRTARGLGVSIGSVTFTDPVDTVDEMVAKADQRMYGVKREGKLAGLRPGA